VFLVGNSNKQSLHTFLLALYQRIRYFLNEGMYPSRRHFLASTHSRLYRCGGARMASGTRTKTKRSALVSPTLASTRVCFVFVCSPPFPGEKKDTRWQGKVALRHTHQQSRTKGGCGGDGCASCTALIHCTHTLHSYTALIHCTHTLHSYTALIHCTHTLHSYTALMHCTHALHSYTHTLHSYAALIRCTHTLHSYTALIHCTPLCYTRQVLNTHAP
jgi:hypothetical protein